MTYGSSDSVAASLRTGVGGRLNVDVRRNREYLPHATNKSGSCDVSHEAEVCYASGTLISFFFNSFVILTFSRMRVWKFQKFYNSYFIASPQLHENIKN
jgi:hypothetical protein